MSTRPVTLSTPLVGLFPFALVQIVDEEKYVAQVDVGGIDKTSPEDLFLVAKALRSSAAGVRHLARQTRRADRKARRAAKRTARTLAALGD